MIPINLGPFRISNVMSDTLLQDWCAAPEHCCDLLSWTLVGIVYHVDPWASTLYIFQQTVTMSGSTVPNFSQFGQRLASPKIHPVKSVLLNPKFGLFQVNIHITLNLNYDT